MGPLSANLFILLIASLTVANSQLFLKVPAAREKEWEMLAQQIDDERPQLPHEMLRAVKKSVAMGRLSFRPGKRASGFVETSAKYPQTNIDNDYGLQKRNVEVDDRDIATLMEDSMGKRSLTFGRTHFRPGKRSEVSQMSGVGQTQRKRSSAMGRLDFRPGKRSLVFARNGLKPGKQPTTIPAERCNTELEALSREILLLLEEHDLMSKECEASAMGQLLA